MAKKKSISDVMENFGQISFSREELSTGSLALNALINGGDPARGIPFGETLIMWGIEQSGKSTLAYQMVSEALADKRRVVWVDAEARIAPEWAAQFGATFTAQSLHSDSEERYNAGSSALLIRSTSTMKLTLENFFDNLLYPLLESENHPHLFVLDSIPDVSSQQVYESDADKKFFGVNAAIWSQQFPVIKQYLVGTDCVLVLLNQARANMGVPGYHMVGGHVLKHAASASIYLKPVSTNRDGKTIGENYFVDAKLDKSSLGGQRYAETGVNFRIGNINSGLGIFDVVYDIIMAGRQGVFVSSQGEPITGGNAKMYWLDENQEPVELGKSTADVYSLLSSNVELTKRIYMSMAKGHRNEKQE